MCRQYNQNNHNKNIRLSFNVTGTHAFRIAMFYGHISMQHTQSCVTLKFKENPAEENAFKKEDIYK